MVYRHTQNLFVINYEVIADKQSKKAADSASLTHSNDNLWESHLDFNSFFEVTDEKLLQQFFSE